MPWSLRKFLSKDTTQQTDGGDKERGKNGKSSKRGKLKQKADGDSVAESTKTSKDERVTNLDTSESKSENNTPTKNQSSDDSFLSGGSINKDETIKSDDEYKSIDEFPADCSNLTGYLETAIMESDTSTLERYGKSMEKNATPANKSNDAEKSVENSFKEQNESVNSGETPDVASSSFDRGLYIEYVNYDFLGPEGGSNGGSSGEYYSSDDDEKFVNSNNNSNSISTETRTATIGGKVNTSESNVTNDSPRADTTGSLGRNGLIGNNNIPNTGYYDKNTRNRKTEKLSSSATERDKNSGNDDDKSSENDIIDPHDTSTGERNIKDATTEDKYYAGDIGLERQHETKCPLYNGNAEIKEYSSDMEKARSIFGMCLCQNGEQVDNVTDLDFRNCNLKEVPQEIFQYSQTLTHLQLDSNTLSDLPKSLFSCESLEYLTVSDNDLGSLPPALASLQSLKYLDISKNVIEDVPDCIRCCKTLSVLDASVNPIEKLSEGFTQLVGLHELYLNDCFLEFLPANFGRLTQLSVLELRDNQLQILPKSIRRLTLLKRLDLGGNIFQEWPSVVCELRKLTELWLDGNELSKVPDEIGDLTSLVYLDLSRNFIEAIPSQIGSLRDLTDLLLCENHITVLPDTIGFLDKLTMLKVSMNQLTGVPESIGKLQEIEELDLSHNKIIDVPPSIGNLTSMHTLLLDNNILTSIPPELGRCGKLNVLQLSRNVLDEIPREIGELSQLRVFNICRNRLQNLPITVIKLAQLEALWVSSNQSKPNVPLHAELHKDGKTRILTNILFPQTEHDTSNPRIKTDEEGYANDAADDDEPPLFRKQRGVTRVAFNLQLIQHSVEYSDEDAEEEIGVDVPLIQKDQNSNTKFPLNDQDHHNLSHSVDVSEDLISSNGNGLRIQPTSLMVKSPEKRDEDEQHEGNGSFDEQNSDTIPLVNGIKMNSKDNEIVHGAEEWAKSPPSYSQIPILNSDSENVSLIASDSNVDSPLPDLLNGEGNMRTPKKEAQKSFSVPDLSKSQIPEEKEINTSRSTPVDNEAESEATMSPKIKMWSSHSHLPAIPVSEPTDVVKPVAAEIISNRSSMSSSPCSTPELQKNEFAKISKLPIPSRALFERVSTKSEEIKNCDNEVEPPKIVQPPKKVPLNTQYSLTDIPFMDSESDNENDISDKVPLVTKPKKGAKPPPPPRKESLFSKASKPGSTESSPVKPPVPANKPMVISVTGPKVFIPSLLQTKKIPTPEVGRLHDPVLSALPVDNKPPGDVSPGDGLAQIDRDSGVGNDVDSQESIPECPDEDLPSPPRYMLAEEPENIPRSLAAPVAPKPTIKSVANFQIGDSRPQVPPKVTPKPSLYSAQASNSETVPKVPPPVPNKISASIKMFEKISSPEHKPQPTNKSLADLLPTGPRRTEEKAIIRPNNHLNGFVENKNATETTKVSNSYDVSPSKPALPEISSIILEPHSREAPVMFVRESTMDSDDPYAFSKALAEVTSPTQKRKLSRSNLKSNDSTETAKQNQFRERLEKIMQQQKNVSAATKAAQIGATNSLTRKSSFHAMSQPTSPDGLENLTAENSFPSPESPTSPLSPDPKISPKKHSTHDRMKNKLDRSQGGSSGVKSASSSRIARARPGSAPAAQLLQRRNSNQRNSIAAPENTADEKRTLAPLYGSDERAGIGAHSRSKSIEQQLGQLFLDSDEELLNHNEQAKYERHHNDVIRRDHALKKYQSGIGGSRNSLCSPPPVRHNMYAKARSSNNTASAPLADWKHKLLQHIERKRVEKQQISALQNSGRPPRTQQPQQSIGKIKSPPRTSGPPLKPQYNERAGVNYVTTQPQSRLDRQMTKSVTAPSLMAPTKTITNTHQYNPEGPVVRSHFAGNSRAAKLAKQRTFTPGPENHGNVQMMAPRPKSAMEKYASQSPPEPLYAEPPSYRHPPPQPALYADLRSINPPLPTYEDHLHRRVAPYAQESNPAHRLVRSESTRKSFRGQGRGNYEDIAGYPLRQSGSHESLMDAARYNQHDPYFPTTPIRNASSHDSILDQPPYHQNGYSAQYYSPPQQPRRQNNGYTQQTHVPQRYPVAENPKRNKYNSPDYVTYVNVYDYERSPVEYHNRPQLQSNSDPYRAQLGYRGSNSRGEGRPQRNSFKREANNYKNYAYPPTSYHNTRQQPPTYDQHYRQRESISPTLYRPLAEREDGSVASAFRPYNQPQQQKTHHRHHIPYAHTQQYALPPNNVMSPTDYKNQGRHMSPPNYHYMPEQPRHIPRPPPGWADTQEDFERVTVSVRRNPTFGFHVMGGVGAGGNPYQPVDDGVFVTHVTPGGAAENKLQAGDKILLVNGSDFVGISHQRAVDLLRNAGQVAVLVVERSLGKPV